MLIKEDTLKNVKTAFDLNEYEVKIWTALLAKGIASAGKIADVSGVPRSRAYDVLETLEKKGFVMLRLGKPMMYMAVSPDNVLSRLKSEIVKHSEEQMTILESIKETSLFKQIGDLYNSNNEKKNPQTASSYIKGRSNSYSQIEELIKNASKSVVIVTNADGLPRKIKYLKNALKKIAKKGVNIRVFAPLSKVKKELLAELKEVAELKDVEMDARFILVDDENLIFMISDNVNVNNNHDDSIWIKSKNFVSAFSKLYREYS